MALGATIFKAAVQISDMDRGYYREHALILARHPSETDERMMVRLLAFCLHASEDLFFGRGLSTDDEPDLWEKDPTGAVLSWIDVGQPDEKRIRKACGRARAVFVYSYGPRTSRVWWDGIGATLQRFENLSAIRLSAATSDLGKLAERTMRLTCAIQDSHAWLANDRESIELALEKLKTPALSEPRGDPRSAR
jgi:uncharacterized protein YaeQ